jgi:hypothetical protein
MMNARNTPYPYHYRAGGNPPVAAGIWSKEGERLAWWPAGCPATEENLALVVEELVLRRRDESGPVSREQIRSLLG